MKLNAGACPKKLKIVLASILATALICSCNGKDLSNLPLEEVSPQEVFIAKTYHKSYGTVQGSRRLYFVYGVSPLKEPAGICLAPTHYARFRIKQLMERFPEISDPRVQKAIEKQEKELF